MIKRALSTLVLVGLLAGCGGQDPPSTAVLVAAATTAAPPATIAAEPTATAELTIIAEPTATAEPTTTATAGATAAATRVGANYVLRLPRESTVPADWIMNPEPGFEARSPGAGDTYRFACLDLPARSTGLAGVGYRHLEGLPNVFIEYSVYPTADDAAAALADMRRAADQCAEFTIGEGDGAIQAALAPLDFPAQGDDSFAAALTTSGPTTGELLTHVVKILRGHVVIGISHANYSDGPPPDAALTESLAQHTVEQIDALGDE